MSRFPTDEKNAIAKQEKAKAELRAAAALEEQRDSINRSLSLRASADALASGQLIAREPAGSRLSAEEMAAFDETIEEHRRHASQLEREAEGFEERLAARAAASNRQAADDLRLLRDKVADTREGAIRRATKLLLDSDGGHLDDRSFATFIRSAQNAAELDRSAERLGMMEQRYRKGEAYWQVREPRVYGPDSPHSYFRDRTAGIAGGGFGDVAAAGAQQRMARYDRELAYEIRAGSPEGLRAERIIAEDCRSEIEQVNRDMLDRRHAELRALTTGGGATATATSGGAALVSPYFAWEAWAPFRGVHRTVADQCDSQPLPPYGMEVYLPAFTSAAAAATQTEGQAVTETDPTTGFQSAQVQTVTGQVTMSQQISDRGFTGGGAFDKLLAKQLQQQLDQALELYVITQALAGAATVNGQSSFTIAGLYQDLASGRGKLTDTAGTRLKPTHLFTTSDFYSYVTRQVDDQHRPIVTPKFAPGFPLAAGDASTKWSRFTGTILPGGVLWFEADEIPTYGTTSETQLIVSAPDEAIVLFEGDPILAAYPQPQAASLEIVLNLRAYVAAVARYPSGTANVAGAAYTASLV